MKALLEKPTPPREGLCCESGSCQPCVWDHYYESMRKWRTQQAEIKEKEEKSTS